MTIQRLALRFLYSLTGALMAIGLSPTWVLAQHDSHGAASQHVQAENKARTNELVQAVREGTRRFQDANVAIAEGYVPTFGCVSGSSEGAMGIHFVNGALVGDGKIDFSQPEIILYEPTSNGGYRLTGVDYLVLVQDWKAAGNAAPPELMGQLFHFFESPNRFGLPEFYTLHVWAWKDNPQGTFANWNPSVSCDAYNPQ